METSYENDFRLKDQLNKCRCCLRTLIDEQKYIKITKVIEKKFFDLTQIQLIEAEVLSNKICQLCNNDLDVFSQFRKDLTSKQNSLYRALDEQQPEFVSTVLGSVKSEINEFIECSRNDLKNNENITQKCDEMCPPQMIIKSEEVERFEEFDENYLNFECLDIEQRKPTHASKNRHKAEFSCDICRFAAHNLREIELHMENHMEISHKATNFYCEYCSQDFAKRHLLNRHIKLKHTEKERLHPCPTCEKSFFTISTLKKHVESHNLKSMPCEFCGKLFSCMNNLRTHLYYHAEPKFLCTAEGCGKKFFMRKLLKAHMNVHQGKKDFVCRYCEKSYFFQSHLKRHTVSAHLKLKIDCEVLPCSSSFARKETYRNHVLQHHQNLGPEGLDILLTKIRKMKIEEFRCVV